MKKRMLSVVLALCLCLTLLPGTALAGEEDGTSLPYISICGKQVTQADQDIPCGEGTARVSYNADTGRWVISLTNAAIEATGYTPAIYCRDSWLHYEIALAGENTISSESRECIGVSMSDLTISGDGTLTAVSTEDTCIEASSGTPYGSSTSYGGNVLISGVSDLTLNGYYKAIGITGALTIQDSKVTAKASEPNGPYNNVIGGRGVEISGSTVSIEAPEAAGYGISSSRDITISQSEVAVVGKGDQFYGIYGDGDVSITDSDVTVESSYLSVYGEGMVTVADSQVTASSAEWSGLYGLSGVTMENSTVESDCYYAAIRSDDSISIADSTVEAASSDDSAIYALGDLTVSGASDVTAEGFYAGLNIVGAVEVNDGQVSAVSTDDIGAWSRTGIAINGGTFHAKGGDGCAAAGVRYEQREEGEALEANITLGEGLAEVSGGRIAVSEWAEGTYNDGTPWTRSWTSFVAADVTEELAYSLENAMNEVTITEKVPDCTVTFDSRGGSAVAGQVVQSGQTAEEPEDPVQAGYLFGGWYTDPDCAAPFDFSTLVTTDLTLYAKWTRITYAVTVETEGSGTASASAAQAAEGTAITLAAVPDEGWRFKEWQSAGVTVTDNAFTMPAADVTVKAVFERIPDPGPEPGPGPDRPDPRPVPVPAPTHPVAVEEPSHGSVSVSRPNASKGSAVTVTAEAEEGYVLESLTVTDEKGRELALTDKGGGRYVFTMPGGEVTVEAVFAPESGEEPCAGGADCPAHGYTDLGGGDAWYHEAVDYVLEKGLMDGYGNGAFGPDDSLSRGQLAQILYNCAGRPAAGGSPFRDVPDGAWCAPAVAWAAEQDIVDGYGGDLFGPDDPITREQLVVMLYRYAGSPVPPNLALNFTDADAVSGYAADPMRWAVERGIISGCGDGRLDPGGPATRAQAAQMLRNFLENQ